MIDICILLILIAVIHVPLVFACYLHKKGGHKDDP